MEVYYDRGIIVRSGSEKIILDPELSSVPIKYPTLVTHAHSDHTAAIPGSSHTYLTKTTLDIYNQTGGRSARNYSFVDFEQPFELGSFEVEYFPAGHLLGAAQICIREGNRVFLYTGDFCPEPLLTVDSAKFPEDDIDVLLMDATYGSQSIKFNPRIDSRQNLFLWALTQLNEGNVPVINVGHVGGAQELIMLFNKLTKTTPIITDMKISEISKIYNQEGLDLTYFQIHSTEAKEILASDNKKILLYRRAFKKPHDLERQYPNLKGKIRRAMVTGQTAKYGYSTFHYTSSLSTHAHYHELLETAKNVYPKQVLTHYGYTKKLAESIMNHLEIPSKQVASCNSSIPVRLDRLPQRKPQSSTNALNVTLDNFF